MATTYVTDLPEASPAPQVVAPSNRVNGRLRTAFMSQTVPITQFDTVDDITLLAQIPSNATIVEFSLNGPAQGAGSLIDIGVCSRQGGNVAASGDSREVIENAAAGNSSAWTTYTDHRFVTLAQTTVGQPLWQLLGYTSDPAREWFACFRIQAVNTPAGGPVTLGLRYVVD